MTGVLNARSKNRTQGNPSPAWSRLSRHRRPIYTAGLKGLMIEPWINQKAHQSWSPGIGPSQGRLSRGASLASPLPYFISADRSPRTSNSHVEFWEEEDCLLENSPRTEKNKASSPHSTRSVPQLHEHQVESPNVAYDTHMNPNHCEITDSSWCPQLTQVSTKIRQQTLITSMNREQSRSRRSVSGACEGGDQIIYNFELAERRERLCLEISYAAHERGWNAGNLAKQYLNDLMKLHPSPSQSYRFVSHVIPRLSELRAIHMYTLHRMYSKEDVLQIPEIAVWDHEVDETLFDTLASEKKRRSYFIEEEKAQRGNLLGFIMGIYRSILNAQSSVIDDLSDYDLQHLEAFKSAFGVNCELGIIDVVQKSHQNTEALVLPHTESILRKKPSMVKTFSKMIKKIGQPPLAKTNRPSLPRTTIHEDIELVSSESEASIASQNENPSSPIGRLMRRLSSTRGRNSHRYIQSDDESKMESSNISQQAPKSHEKEKKKKRKETEKQSNQFNEKEKAKSVVLKSNRSEDRPLTSGISFVAHRAGSVIKSSIKDTLRLDQSSESVVQKAPDENIINPKTTEQVEEHKHQENNTVLQERIGILKERALTTATLPLNHHDTLVSETQHTNAKKQRASLQRDGEDVHDNQHRASHAKQAKSNTASALQQHSIKRESSGQKIIQGKHHHVDTTSGNQNKLECNEVAAYDEETKSVLIDDIVHDVEKLTSKSLKGSTELSRRKHKVSQNDVLQTAEPTQDTFDDAGTYFTARTECSLLEE